MENIEIWKDIPGYESRYQVSNMGQVRSLRNQSGGIRIKVQQELRKNKGLHYKSVFLFDGNKYHTCSVHRLVALAFIPNPDNLPEVNHKDENPSNNKVENLEWCDRKYNINYGTRILRQKVTCKVKRQQRDDKKKDHFTWKWLFSYMTPTEIAEYINSLDIRADHKSVLRRRFLRGGRLLTEDERKTINKQCGEMGKRYWGKLD